MGYKSILVVVDNTAGAAARVDFALALAKRHEARLTGLFAAGIPSGVIGFDGGYIPDPYLAIQKQIEQFAELAHATFISRVGRVEGVQTEWRQHIGAAVDATCVNARYHDLVVVGQHDPEHPVVGQPLDFPELVVFGAGRPVMIVPYAGTFDIPSRRALIGWDAGREATRAVTDALPMLRTMQHTTVMTIGAEVSEMAHGESAGADVALYLARHGLDVDVKRDPGLGLDVGPVMLSAAADMGADLIVMGLYGHSRLRELALGGASRTIMRSMTVPVLASH